MIRIVIYMAILVFAIQITAIIFSGIVSLVFKGVGFDFGKTWDASIVALQISFFTSLMVGFLGIIFFAILYFNRIEFSMEVLGKVVIITFVISYPFWLYKELRNP